VFHGWLYRLLPGFGQLRAPARFVLLLDFALAALAALGLDWLLGPLDRRARKMFDAVWRGLVWLGAAAALVGGAWAYLVVYQAQDRDPTLLWRVSAAASGVVLALLMFGATLAWLGARRSGRLRRGVLAWLAAGLVFVDLATVGAYTDLGHSPPTDGYNHPQVLDFLKSDPGFFRIDSRTDVAAVWQPDLALMAGLYDVGGVDNPLVVADVARYWEGTSGRSTPLYDFLGIRYVLGSKEVTLDWEKFRLAFDDDPEVNIYRNESALPRAFVVQQAIIAADHEDAWAQIHQAGFDPATVVVIEGGLPGEAPGPAEVAGAPGLALQPAGEHAQVVRYRADALEIEVDTPTEGYLVLSDPFYPGWRAEVDGEPAELLRANYAFRAVAVPAGRHQVTMTFRPATWTAGLALSSLTVMILAVWAGLALEQRRRAGRPAADGG
jgi:hypothetical protein